jgi:hypothetical protein
MRVIKWLDENFEGTILLVMLLLLYIQAETETNEQIKFY